MEKISDASGTLNKTETGKGKNYKIKIKTTQNQNLKFMVTRILILIKDIQMRTSLKNCSGQPMNKWMN